MYCTWLYWAELGCTGLFWSVVGCTWLHWTVLGCTGLWWAVLGSTGLYWTVLGFTRLNWAVVGCSRLYCGVMGCAGRSQQLFSVCSAIFSMVTNQLDNQVILEQTCSVRRQSFAISLTECMEMIDMDYFR